MDIVWTEQFTVASHDLDYNGTAKVSALMKCMQECANRQCRALGPSNEALREKDGLAFLLSRFSAGFYESVSAYETLSVQTWAVESRGFSFQRSFRILRKDTIVAEASTVWGLVSIDTRRPVRVTEYHPNFGCGEALTLDVPSRIVYPPSADLRLMGEHTVLYGETDLNRHLNNTHYPDMLCDYLPMDGKRIYRISLNFLNEARLGESIGVYSIAHGDENFFRTVRPDGKTNVEAQLTLGEIESNESDKVPSLSDFFVLLPVTVTYNKIQKKKRGNGMKEYLPEGIKNTVEKESVYTLSSLEHACERGQILEGTAILCDEQMNLHVSVGPYIGIISKEESVYLPEGGKIKDIAILTRVGKRVCFQISNILQTEKGVRLILSRRTAQKECYEKYLFRLRPGDVIPAKVTHTEPFGAFVDIGCGVVALLPIDSISVSRISHPSYRFSIGEETEVVVKMIEENGRIYVSRKELLGTWEENASLFSAGQTVVGTIRSIEPYGIFVELTPNLTGLAEYKDGVKENEVAAVYIKSILPERMKVKLVIIDSHAACGTPSSVRCAPSLDLPSHIDRWRYSPSYAERCIESVFDGSL